MREAEDEKSEKKGGKRRTAVAQEEVGGWNQPRTAKEARRVRVVRENPNIGIQSHELEAKEGLEGPCGAVEAEEERKMLGLGFRFRWVRT